MTSTNAAMVLGDPVDALVTVSVVACDWLLFWMLRYGAEIRTSTYTTFLLRGCAAFGSHCFVGVAAIGPSRFVARADWLCGRPLIGSAASGVSPSALEFG